MSNLLPGKLALLRRANNVTPAACSLRPLKTTADTKEVVLLTKYANDLHIYTTHSNCNHGHIFINHTLVLHNAHRSEKHLGW